MVPALSAGMMAAPENSDMTAGMDINQMNEQSINAMRGMPPAQIMQALEANYAKLIDFVKSLPEEQLNVTRTFGPVPMPVSDVLANIVMLHGIHHVYEANNRIGLGGRRQLRAWPWMFSTRVPRRLTIIGLR
jgi:hypothetical protein